MTTQTETIKQPAKAPSAGFLTGFTVTLAVVAILTWLGGVALNRGFGVHVPFVPGTILLAVALSVVKMAAAEVAQVWHAASLKADIAYLQFETAFQDAMDAQGLLDMDKKLRGE